MYTEIGKAIKQIRLYKGMKQKELVKLSGLSQGHISDLERSMRLPLMEVLYKVANILEVRVSTIIMLAECFEAKLTIGEHIITSEFTEHFIKHFNKLPK